MKESATNIQIFNWGCDFDKTLRYEVKPNTAAYSCTLSKLISTWNRNSATLKTLLPSFFICSMFMLSVLSTAGWGHPFFTMSLLYE